MKAYISFGKEKDKEKHIKRINNWEIMSFYLAVHDKKSNKTKYINAECWDKRFIREIELGDLVKIKDFYIKFFENKNNETIWIIVINDWTIEKKAKEVSEEEFVRTFNRTNEIKQEKEKQENKNDDFEWETFINDIKSELN